MTTFSFMRYRNLFFVISLAFLIPGMVSLFLYRVKPSIDFTGGSLLEVEYQQGDAVAQPEREELQERIGESPELISVQTSGNNQAILRMATINNQQKDEIITKLQARYPQLQELRFETVGPVLGRELMEKTIVAIVLV